ncbi:winged helix-turn-helix transcriptional regulator [Mesobacillus zeae]|uniref:Transcriptional regulator n=1 Tax=Mesobacillus zeae TaxID=1917180 RepID=A0A398BJY2_9BACI|nr:helix-turn-helix domain-containing protein [Mesobacillus zeae]RID87756.1 transcriptional regulator [Mesobacillus zeae]
MKKSKENHSNSDLCPKFEAAMELLSKRWAGLIITQLLAGKKRFTEISSSIPISGRLLSARLKELEELHLVTRVVHDETPVRIEYILTDKGHAMEPVIDAVTKWAQEWGEK